MNQKHEAATNKTRRFSFLSSSRFNFFTSCIIPPLLLLQRRVKYFSVLPNTLDGQDNPKFLRTQKPPASFHLKKKLWHSKLSDSPFGIFYSASIFSKIRENARFPLRSLMFMSESFKHKSSNTVTQQYFL